MVKDDANLFTLPDYMVNVNLGTYESGHVPE